MTAKLTIMLPDDTYDRAMQLVQSGGFPHMSGLVQRAVNVLLEAEDTHKARSMVLRGELIARAEGGFLDADGFQAETNQLFAELLANPWTA